MIETEELSGDSVEYLDTSDELVIDLEENVSVDATMATKTDEVQSIFDELPSSPKVKESETVSFQKASWPTPPMKFYVPSLLSKGIAEREKSEKLENKPNIYVEETVSSGNADIVPENKQDETIRQVATDVAMDFVVGSHQQQHEEAKLIPEPTRSLSRRPLRKRSSPEANKQLEHGKHSVLQTINDKEENFSVTGSKAGNARFPKKMKQESAIWPANDNVLNPRKRRRNKAVLAQAKNSKIAKVQLKQTKRQSGSLASIINHVTNPSEDSQQVIDVKEIMKDMSKLLPAIVLERVAIPRDAVPLQVHLSQQNGYSSKTQKAPSEPVAKSSLQQNGTSTELDSTEPLKENCVALDVFLSSDQIDGDAKSNNTVICQLAPESSVVFENLDSLSKEKRPVPEDAEDSAGADSPSLILDVNLEISVKDEVHVKIQDVPVTGRKRSVSGKGKKASPNVKPLRDRRFRAAKVVALEPVGGKTTSRRRAVPSLQPMPSPNGTAQKSETTENVKAVSEEKTLLTQEEKISQDYVAGLPDNIEIPSENEAASCKQHAVLIGDLGEASLNGVKNLSTAKKPPKIRRGRGTRAKVAAHEPTIGKPNNETSNNDVKQINMGQSSATGKK